jgi:pimeloyl-ACP methyl ester carboxylesterase
MNAKSPANNGEYLDAPAAFTEVANIDSSSGFPMIVATADHHSYPGLAASEEARLDDAWNAGQGHWVSLASSAQLMTVDNTGHNIQLDRPDVVLERIHELLQ